MTDDIDRIMHIMGTAFDPVFGEAWNRRQLSDSLLMPTTHYYLVDPDGETCTETTEPAGFALTRAAPGEEELLLIAVQPQFRGRGLGRMLLEQFEMDTQNRGAECIFLEMRENNPAARLYNSFGFEPVGRRKGYYRMTSGDRIDAITFRKGM